MEKKSEQLCEKCKHFFERKMQEGHSAPAGRGDFLRDVWSDDQRRCHPSNDG